MRAFLPTLRQLSYLVALADQRHFGRAAATVAVSQSTLSAGLQELEQLLGVTLVERSRRSVRFTPLGEQVVHKARELLRGAEELTDIVQAEAEPMSGELRMAVIPTIAPFLLPGLLTELKQRYPQLRLTLREETSSAACDALQRGAVDCVLLALPFACGSNVESEELFDDPLLLAMPADHPLADKGPVNGSALEPAALLMLEDGHCLKDHALAACGALRGDAAMLGTSLHTLVQMVSGGLGLTFLPQMAVKAGLADQGTFAIRPLTTGDGQPAMRTIALIWRKGSAQRRNFELLARSIKSVGEA